MIIPVLFPENMFLNIPSMPRHAVTLGHDGVRREWTLQNLRPCIVMNIFRIGSRFFRRGHNVLRVTKSPSVGIVPCVLQWVKLLLRK